MEIISALAIMWLVTSLSFATGAAKGSRLKKPLSRKETFYFFLYTLFFKKYVPPKKAVKGRKSNKAKTV